MNGYMVLTPERIRFSYKDAARIIAGVAIAAVAGWLLDNFILAALICTLAILGPWVEIWQRSRRDTKQGLRIEWSPEHIGYYDYQRQFWQLPTAKIERCEYDKAQDSLFLYTASKCYQLPDLGKFSAQQVSALCQALSAKDA